MNMRAGTLLFQSSAIATGIALKAHHWRQVTPCTLFVHFSFYLGVQKHLMG